MPRVRSYRRQDGIRVRGHYRARRATGGRSRRRSVLRRAAAPGAVDRSGWWLWAIGGLIAVLVVVEFVQRHPVWSITIAVGLVTVVVAGLWLSFTRRARLAEQEAVWARHVVVTDAMTGPEFERWVAGVLTNAGFSGVTVCGGAADRGADIIATAPDGRRAVVQCKRRNATNRVGSAEIQRFAGTCRSIHRGQLCLIVTNGFFSAGDGVRLARELNIVLVDRPALATWAQSGTLPTAITSVPPVARR